VLVFDSQNDAAADLALEFVMFAAGQGRCALVNAKVFGSDPLVLGLLGHVTRGLGFVGFFQGGL
jgi:hypothetical protein